MSEKIFGYSWEEIQKMQQKEFSHKIVKPTKEGRPSPTEEDKELLALHGVEGLKKLELYGVLDRLGF